jgi:PKD repeat protein
VTGRNGTTIRLSITASDRERNISELKIDFGDGSSPATGYRTGDLPRSHTFAQPGKYKVKLTVTDFYSRRATATVQVTV